MRFIFQLWSDETHPASPARVDALARFNERLAQAGVLLAAEGLVASEAALRLTHARGEHEVTLGPFRVGPTLGSGFWIVRAGSTQEALSWAKLCPLHEDDVLELRALYGPDDLPLLSSELVTS